MLATKTLEAINSALMKDQGAKFRGLLKNLMPLAGDAYSTDEFPFRSHLGASLIGRECARELWYSFRWCTKNEFDGRMLRLFNRGHLEEPRMVALLQMIGCEVWQVTEDGKQFRITGHLGHFGGSMDAVVRGVPDLPPDTPALAEFKTHGEKSFIKLQTSGVLEAKWEHFVQMQLYMGKNHLTHALYGAVNKNTDELYMEIVEFDPAVYQRYLARSVQIVDARTPPPKIGTTIGFFKCKFCDHKKLCFLDTLPERTCRSCIHSTIEDGGVWVCKNVDCIIAAELQGWEDPIDLGKEAQLAACSYYSMIPEIKG